MKPFYIHVRNVEFSVTGPNPDFLQSQRLTKELADVVTMSEMSGMANLKGTVDLGNGVQYEFVQVAGTPSLNIDTAIPVDKIKSHAKSILVRSAKSMHYDAAENGEQRPVKDSAHKAALAILNDLTDRRGIKQGFDNLDHDVRVEIVDSMSEIIRQSRDTVRYIPNYTENSGPGAHEMQHRIMYKTAEDWGNREHLSPLERVHGAMYSTIAQCEESFDDANGEHQFNRGGEYAQMYDANKAEDIKKGLIRSSKEIFD